ncbi:cyclase [Sulfodiicoccus acidiphilus]|uniref:Cyclase n=1 Tax=Sulfodiicoccus acidiphilus TaxID=1670455 RepID=A0A348B1H2_9CREN|nr:cyclase [Sulfodiicoccus acidiphilus]
MSKAKVYDLGQPYWWGMPVHPADPPFLFFLYRYHEHTKDLFQSVAPGFADSISLIVTSMHAGTHIDLPIHMSRNLKVMGHDVTKYETDKGYSNLPEGLLTMDALPPLVLRGVLFDVPKAKKLDILPERYEITPTDLEEALSKEGAELKGGDCVLVRTGYSRFFRTDREKYLHDFAGLGAAAAKWLVDRGAKVVAVDNLAAGVPKPFEVHNIVLSDNGRLMMKSINLEELSKDEKWVTTVFILPLKIVGGEASLVRPIAIG